MESLYEKYGGFATISAIVHDFYERVLDSEPLARFFVGVDMERLVEHQTAFFCKILSGPDNYTGRSLRGAHRGLGIDDQAFDEVATILGECLEDAGVEAADIATIGSVLESIRADVVVPDQAPVATPAAS